MAAREPAYARKEDFEVIRELGRGGFSIVKEVHRKGAEKGVTTACKITPLSTVKKQWTTIENAVQRMERLKKLSESINSPFILRFFDWQFSDEDKFSFFELARGGDLFSRILAAEGQRFTEDQGKRLSFNLCKAMKTYMDEGIIHRDLKPENILYRQVEADVADIVLGDFASCVELKKADDLVSGMAGSLGYMAPEMAVGFPYNCQVDIFSAGVTVYEVLTGRSPWRSTTLTEYLSEVVERDIPFPLSLWSPLSPQAKDFVSCMLLRDPDARWTVNKLLAHPWLQSMPTASTGSRPDDLQIAPLPQPIDETTSTEDSAKAVAVNAADPGVMCLSSKLTTSLSARRHSHVPLMGVVSPHDEGVFTTQDLLSGGPLMASYSARFAKLDSSTGTDVGAQASSSGQQGLSAVAGP